MEPGDELFGIEGVCYREIQTILSDPTNEWYIAIEDEGLMPLVREMLGNMQYDDTVDFWYAPENLMDDFALLGGKYGEAMEALQFIGEDGGYDCEFQTAIPEGLIMINSHQGVGGL